MSPPATDARPEASPPQPLASPQPTTGPRLYGLPPVLDARCRLVVLGSFPGAASLAQQQYYAHPRNHFWAILGQLWSRPLLQMAYAERLQTLLAHGLGVWDVYASCVRTGSLDAHIRQPVLNDFSLLAQRCPALVGLAHNGAASHRQAHHAAQAAWAVYRLPSSSPANASWSLARKCAAWQAVFAACGMA